MRMEGNPKITFKKEETECFNPNHDYATVVSLRMINARVKRTIIDIGSSANIFYNDPF